MSEVIEEFLYYKSLGYSDNIANERSKYLGTSQYELELAYEDGYSDGYYNCNE